MTDPVGKPSASRREFLKTSAIVAAGTAAHLASVPNAFAAGSDIIKVGLVGCGGRGTGAAEQSITASSNVKLYAMGDLFGTTSTAARQAQASSATRSTSPTTASSSASTPTRR